MMDLDTFLTTLYVMIDDFCQSEGFHEKHRPGPQASLSCSEVVTLAVFGQWAQFPSERAYYRYALSHLRAAFPTLPDREQFNRVPQHHRDVIVAFSLFLVDQMEAQHCLYEALDSSGIPTRDAKRRGTGWLAGQADIGWSNRIGWYEGFHLLTSITPTGVISGFGKALASCNDHPLAETFFAARAHPSPRLKSVGAPARGASMWLTKASQGIACIVTGKPLTVRRSSALPINAAKFAGPNLGDAGWPGCARSLRPFMTSCSIPSGWLGSAHIPWTAFKRAWLRKSLCITFASGSTCSWAASHWLSPICSTGKFVISIHTKRLNVSTIGARVS